MDSTSAVETNNLATMNNLVAMNQCEIALFLASYLYLLNMAAANDAQRVILLSRITQIRALQAQILVVELLKFNVYHCTDADPRTSVSACTSPAQCKNYLRRYPKREI